MNLTHRALISISLALTSAMSGCALPDYHLPNGFSSTYYRHLQQAQTPMQPVETTSEVKRAWWRPWAD